MYNTPEILILEEDMKEKLAPIHFVQYNRIYLQETLENHLVKAFSLEDTHAQAMEQFGSPSQDVSLELQIDQDNIHGWLEGHLVANEKRIAQLVKKVLESQGEEALQEAYAAFGQELGQRYAGSVSLNSSQELYQFITTVLLDGMPCDKVNQLVEASEDTLVWHAVRDVHGKYYNEAGVHDGLFYTLRESFLGGVLQVLGSFAYSIEVEDDAIINQVKILN